MKRFLSVVTLALAFAGAMLVASSARAQTLSVRVSARTSGRSLDPTRAGEGMNLALCQEPETITFQITGLTTGRRLFLFRGNMGDDCSIQTNRTGASAQCTQVGEDVGVTMSMQSFEYAASTLFDCTSSAQTSAALWFLEMTAAGDATALSQGSFTFPYDFRAPPAVTGVTATAGATTVAVRWTAPSDTTDVFGYRILIQEATTTSTSDGDGGTTSTTSCSSAAFSAGATPTSSVIDSYGHNSADKTAESSDATGVTVGHRYAVAVVAYDQQGNYGVASNVVCTETQPVTDFWEAYTAGGGRASECNAAPGRALPRTGAWIVLMALSWVARRRWRRR